jgi:hypothetical protein
MLHARLITQPNLSLLEQDLEFLSDVRIRVETKNDFFHFSRKAKNKRKFSFMRHFSQLFVTILHKKQTSLAKFSRKFENENFGFNPIKNMTDR